MSPKVLFELTQVNLNYPKMAVLGQSWSKMAYKWQFFYQQVAKQEQSWQAVWSQLTGASRRYRASNSLRNLLVRSAKIIMNDQNISEIVETSAFTPITRDTVFQMGKVNSYKEDLVFTKLD